MANTDRANSIREWRPAAVVAALTLALGSMFTSTPGAWAQESIGALDTPPDVRVNRATSNPDYPVTPGDVYELTWTVSYSPSSGGTGSQNSLILYVEPDYTVNMEFLGSIDGRGMRFQELRDEVLSTVKEAYPGSFARLVVRGTGEISVRIEGEVTTATEIPVWGLTRLSDLPNELFTEYASRRAIEITARSGESRSYDLFAARRFGEAEENPLLKVGDTIRVPAVDRRVAIEGQVRRPGAYELREDEGFDTLLRFAGGYTAEANRQEISVTSLAEAPDTGRSTAYRSADELGETRLANGDIVAVPSRSERQPVVFLEGALGRDGAPGAATRISRTISRNVRVSDVARAASELFTPASDLENAYLHRAGGNIVPIDLIDLLYGTGELTANPVLEHEDVLVVPFKQFQVTVLGAVARPGTQPYIPNKSWRYYVRQAGGVNPDLNRGQEIEIRDAQDNVVDPDEAIGPEYTIVAKRNAVRFWFLRSAELATTGIDLFNAVYSLLQTFDIVEP